MVSKLAPEYQCRDLNVGKSWEADELCHDTGTLEGLAGMLDRGEQLNTGKVTIDAGEGVRLWLGHGSGDLITSCEASKKFVDRCQVKDKEFKVFDGYYHCSKCLAHARALLNLH